MTFPLYLQSICNHSMVMARWKQQLFFFNEPRCPTCGIKHTVYAPQYVHTNPFSINQYSTVPSSKLVADPNVCAADSKHRLPMYTMFTYLNE